MSTEDFRVKELTMYQKAMDKYEFCRTNKLTEVMWHYISTWSLLEEDFMREFQDKLNWPQISISQPLSDSFIEDFKDKIDWNAFSYSTFLKAKHISKYADLLNWEVICKHHKLFETQMREFQDKLHWESVSIFQTFSDNFLHEFSDKLVFERPYIVPKYINKLGVLADNECKILNHFINNDNNVSMSWNDFINCIGNKSDILKVAEAFKKDKHHKAFWVRDNVHLNAFKESEDKITFCHKYKLSNYEWGYISRFMDLEEDFMREFQDKLEWDGISVYQKLSDEFVEEFKDKFYWDSFCCNKHLTEDRMRKYIDKLHWERLCEYQKLSEIFMREFQDKLHWGNVSIFQILSDEFVKEFKDKLTFDRAGILFAKPITWNEFIIKTGGNHQRIMEMYQRIQESSDK